MIGEELDINADVRPDFGRFLDRFDGVFPHGDLRPMLLFETSRGCSWGEKVACTFCGLNGMSMNHRAMNPATATAHLRSLFDYVPRCSFFLGVDTIVPSAYLTEVFPGLGTPPRTALMYEVRSDLGREQLLTLCAAGVHVIQPGIEALSTATLRLMRKGSTAFRNIRFLKSAVGLPLRIEWNLLIGSPGEDEATWEKYLADLPSLFHLHPPTGVYPISFDRYSVYFLRPEEFGLALEPREFYRHTFPFDREAVANVAYHFVDRRADHDRIERWLDRLGGVVDEWRERAAGARLCWHRDGGESVVRDTRCGRLVEHAVGPVAAGVLGALEVPRTRANLTACLQERGVALPADKIGRELDRLLADRLLFEEDGRFLSLVTGSEAGGGRGFPAD